MTFDDSVFYYDCVVGANTLLLKLSSRNEHIQSLALSFLDNVDWLEKNSNVDALHVERDRDPLTSCHSKYFEYF